jgi:hypothetical protein
MPYPICVRPPALSPTSCFITLRGLTWPRDRIPTSPLPPPYAICVSARPLSVPRHVSQLCAGGRGHEIESPRPSGSAQIQPPRPGICVLHVHEHHAPTTTRISPAIPIPREPVSVTLRTYARHESFENFHRHGALPSRDVRPARVDGDRGRVLTKALELTHATFCVVQNPSSTKVIPGTVRGLCHLLRAYPYAADSISI